MQTPTYNYEIIESKWPWGTKSAFCLNFDDLSPLKILWYDFGGGLNNGVNEVQNKLLNSSDVKTTHFVIPRFNFWIPIRKIDKLLNYETERYSLDNPKNRRWLSWLKEQEQSKKIEIAWHGYKHFNRHIVKKHIEFIYAEYSETKEILNRAYEIFLKAGIEVKGFRQPGWGFKEDYNLFRALSEFPSIKYIASSSFDAGLNQFQQTVNNWEIDTFNNIINIPQNLVLETPYDTLTAQIDAALEKEHIITLKGHWGNVSWVPNSLTKKNVANLKKVIEYLKTKNVWYATFSEVAEYYNLLRNKKVEYSNNAQERSIIYKFEKPCPGFTLKIKNRESDLYQRVSAFDYFILDNTNNNYEIVFQSERVGEYKILINNEDN